MASVTKKTKSKRLEQIEKIVRARIQPDQITETEIPFLRLIQFTKPTPMTNGILKPSLCLIISGAKRIQIGDEVIKYGPGDYLISTIDMPIAGQVLKASRKDPYIGLSITLDPKDISEVLIEAEISDTESGNAGPAAYVSSSAAELKDAMFRLVKLLEKPRPNFFLAKTIKRELLYHLLTGPEAIHLSRRIMIKQSEQGIDKAITWLKKNFDQPLEIGALAKHVSMSISSLHHKFKSVTTMGPLQYQKRLRLQQARQLLLSGEEDVSGAASKVGYESHSQFSREYRRLFGAPPLQDVKRLRKDTRALLQN